MADKFDKKTRSRIMSRIRSKNTRPERSIAAFLAANGISGFRRNYDGLPGKPDFVFLKKRTVLFYNSSFWHCRKLFKILGMKPFWRRKLLNNWKRDILVNIKLLLMGYRIVTIWDKEYLDRGLLWAKIKGLR